MAKQPSVSVILPFRNAEATLGAAIKSMLDQSYKDFELILIDNSSSDSSRSIAEVCLSDKRVKLVSQPKIGVVHAANMGLDLARGKLIARMDADDISFPNRLTHQVAYMNENPHIDLVSGKIEYGGDPKNGGFIRYVNWLNEVVSQEEINLNQFVEYPIVNPSILFRRTIIEKYGKYIDGDFPEDYEYFLRLQSNGVQMGKVESEILRWNDLSSRLSRTDSKYSPDSFSKIKAKYLAQWLEKNNPNHPEVMIWGARKNAKRRSSYLMEFGIELRGFIDIDPEKNNAIHYKDIPSYKSQFVLSFVSNWDARDKIRNHLITYNFTEGVDFLICG